eukprot:SAG11_NODE_26842_length_340_cov_0.647303_2_plen_60_part_01
MSLWACIVALRGIALQTNPPLRFPPSCSAVLPASGNQKEKMMQNVKVLSRALQAARSGSP